MNYKYICAIAYLAGFKLIKQKQQQQQQQHIHNILRLFDGWANFPFPTSDTKRDY